MTGGGLRDMFLHPGLIGFYECAPRCLFRVRGLRPFFTHECIAQPKKISRSRCLLVPTRLFKNVQKVGGQRSSVTHLHLHPPRIYHFLRKSARVCQIFFNRWHAQLYLQKNATRLRREKPLGKPMTGRGRGTLFGHKSFFTRESNPRSSSGRGLYATGKRGWIIEALEIRAQSGDVDQILDVRRNQGLENRQRTEGRRGQSLV